MATLLKPVLTPPQSPAARSTPHQPGRGPAAGARRAALIEQHLPLVHHVARRLSAPLARRAVVDYEDLVSSGVEGLIRAVDSFDPARGTQFSTWAVLHIRTTIQDGLRALDPVSHLMRRRHHQIEAARTTLAQAQGTWPADAAVAEVVGLTAAQVQRCDRRTSLVSVSLDVVTEDQGAGVVRSWQDVLADEDPAVNPAAVADRTVLRQLLAAALARLPERERTVLLAVSLEGVSQRVVAQRFGVSEARASQLRAQALRRLRAHLTTTLELRESEKLVA
jgi:RNA polymerase sigma factor FliA